VDEQLIRNVMTFLSTLTPEQREKARSVCAVWGFDLVSWEQAARLEYDPDTDTVTAASVLAVLEDISRGGRYALCPDCGSRIRLDP